MMMATKVVTGRSGARASFVHFHWEWAPAMYYHLLVRVVQACVGTRLL